MVISANSQLGLRFRDENVKIVFLKLMKDYLEKELGITQSLITKITNTPAELIDSEGNITLSLSDEEKEHFDKSWNDIPESANMKRVRDKVTNTLGGDSVIINCEDSKYYFICESVYKAAELIKVSSGFTGRTLKDIHFGKYTYLMGKHRMVRFVVKYNTIKGFYFDDLNNVVFEWGIEMENGEYFFSHSRTKEFSEIMRILTFVELGDIEVKILQAGRNNGGKKNLNKITNTSQKTVYVVDSNWNTLTIRTEGFAVRGHFRLQPCGHNMADRKLIWIDAFEKHGYKRRPTGEIAK